MSVTSESLSHSTAQRILENVGEYGTRAPGAPLVLAVGLPGTGKSTFCRQLAKRSNAALLESDLLRAHLFDPPTFESTENKRLFGAIREVTSILLKRGAPVVVDATNLRECDRSEFYDVAAEAGATTLVVHFVAPEAAILDRLEARSRHLDPEDRSSATVEVYRRMAETEEPILRNHRVVDTSRPAEIEHALSQLVLEIESSGPVTPSITGGRNS